MTLAEVLTNIVFTCSFEFTSVDNARVFGQTDSVAGKDMTAETGSKPEGAIAFLTRVRLQVCVLMLVCSPLATFVTKRSDKI